MKKIPRKCGTCGFLINNQCAVSNVTISDLNTTYFCAFHNPQPEKCQNCRKPLISNAAFLLQKKDKTYLQLCEKCVFQMNSCYGCNNNKTCDFETNPSPLPKFVIKQIQQGMMTARTQIKNPERIKITCGAGCPCYLESAGCMREELQKCSNYSQNF